MISLNKIFFGILTSIILTWLVYNTFLSQNYKDFEDVYYKKIENGTYWLNINNNELEISSLWEEYFWIKIDYINQYDKILSYSWKIASIDNKTNDINLEKWFFLINLSEINWEYKINWEWFEIKTKWPTSVFIDNSWFKTNIFSLNTNIELNLINIENNKKINTIFLYPHNYIKIIPSQNKNVENADLLKLTQRFPIEYFSDRILIDWNINNDIITQIIWSKNEVDNNNIKNMFLFLHLNNINENKYLSDFKVNKFWTLIWEKFILQYNKLFLNEAKKTIYYKNLILRAIWDIINSEKVNNTKNQFLIDSLNDLKQISESDYNEMKTILYFYSSLVIDWWKEDITSKINFSKIYNSLENINYNFRDDYLIKLNDFYFKYDFNSLSNLYKELSIINDYILKNWLDENKKSYFIFYINKTIISWFEDIVKNSDIKLNDILSLFDNYITTSIDYYSSSDNIRVRTWIEAYNEILKKLAIKIKDTYFESERDNQGLLTPNKNNIISTEKVKILEKNIKEIFTYYEINKHILWNRTKENLIKTEFETSKLIYNEYINALKDYYSYTANYNENNKQILYWDTASDSNDLINALSIEKAKKYLNNFNYIDFSFVKISLRWINYCNNNSLKYDEDWIEEPFCYKIENLIVWNNLYLNMTLSPKNYNNISNFVINGDNNINKWSYKLDNEKDIWEENYKKNAWSISMDKYDFKNFFLYIFNSPESSATEKIIIDNPVDAILEESIIVKIFKRNKLLWENGDFQIISSFINIKYDDVIVNEIENNYDIFIKNWKLIYTSPEKTYFADISSKYIFLNEHNFINPELKFYNNENHVQYNWNTIKIIWKFNINKIEDDFKNIFNNLNHLQEILDYIDKAIWIKNLDIYYNYIENTFYIKNIEYGIEFKIKWISVNSIIYKWNEKLTKSISIYDLEKTLELIK